MNEFLKIFGKHLVSKKVITIIVDFIIEIIYKTVDDLRE